MKKGLALLFASVVVLVLFAGCSGGSNSGTASKTPATTQDYVDAITSSRSDEENEVYEILTNESGDNEMTLSFFGVAKEDMGNYAISTSMINVKAYGIAIIMPAEGKEQNVLDAVNSFVEMQQKAQENYLPDQYAIAKAAVVKQLDSGEVILAMCENSSSVASSIEKALK